MSLPFLLSKDTATLQRPNMAGRDGAGAVTRPTWSTIATDIPVRIAPPSGSQRAAFAQQQIEISWTVITQSDEPKNGDRFLTSDGRYLRIMGYSPIKTMGGIPSFNEFPCQEVKQ